MEKTLARTPRPEADQTIRLNHDTKVIPSFIRIAFTDPRLTIHRDMIKLLAA